MSDATTKSANRGGAAVLDLPQGMADRVANLSPAKLRLLMQHLAKQRGQDVAEPPELTPRATEGPVPASFSQQRLWFLDRLEPGSTAYALPSALRLTGRLDRAALHAALARLVARHEVLRATFREAEDAAAAVLSDVLQEIHSPGAHAASRVRLPLVDLAALADDRATAEAHHRAEAEARRPFDLAAGPLFRNTLLRLGDDRHVLLQNMHHVVSDGWSRGVLVSEMAALYEAEARGDRAELPPLEISYGDFCDWQRRWLRDEALEGMLDAWRHQLAGAPPELTLPPDRPRPARRTGAGGVAQRALPAGLVERLEEVGRAHGATLFMTLLAGLAVLLHRYTGATDLVLGSPIANRQDRRLERVVGFFVNTLALRVDVSGRPTFAELLGRVKETALAAYAHQDLPFDKLVEELAPERTPGLTPVFQGMFALENVPAGRLEVPGMTFEEIPADSGAAKFDWIFNMEKESGVEKDGDAWRLRVEYSRELYDEASVERWMDHLERLLAGAAETPGRRVGDLPMLSPGERRDLLAEWNRPQPAPEAEPPTLPQLFARQVAERPDAPAVVDGDERWTYGELAARAWRLARWLRRRGVSRGDRVALLIDRSPLQVAAILGVLHAGAAYVPLDPQAPPARVADSLADAFDGRQRGPRLLLTAGDLAARAAAGGDLADAVSAASVETRSIERRSIERRSIEILRLDDPAVAEALAAEEASAPDVALSADDLAYVLYTSGSTGKPKGVAMPHGRVSRLMSATAGWFDFGPGDVSSLFHSYAFDVSVFEMWAALAHGGCIAVVPYLVSRSPADFLALLAAEGVTVLSQTPSAFNPLAAAATADGAPRLDALEWVIFAGEALDAADLAAWVERYGDGQGGADGEVSGAARGPKLINMYGITETTVHVTYHEVDAAEVARAVAARGAARAGAGARGGEVGVPIPDLQVHLLDAAGHLVPVGVAGEIHVGGAGLARGYHGRPALTARRFVPDPFNDDAGSHDFGGRRLYKSGDLARRSADGRLHYVGRIDHQVQVRGFRVELGEIEAALADHPAVAEAVVLALPGADGPSLTAYVVPAAGAGAGGPVDDGAAALPGVEQIRAWLSGRLPDYMLPAAFAVLDELPLNRNGKTDRAALAALEATRLGSAAEYVAPRNPVEETLARLWSEVLEVPLAEVGVHHNFFHLGGHSLLATRLLGRLRRDGSRGDSSLPAGGELPLATFFEGPTVAEMAEALQVLAWAAGAADGGATQATADDEVEMEEGEL